MIRIERLDGAAVTAAEDAFRLIYAEVFAGPPYYETEADVAAAFDRFRLQTALVAALATAPDGEPVGMAYGWRLGPRTDWWDRLIRPVPEDVRREDGRRTFGLMELAVRARWRRQGVARRLHEVLVGGLDTERVLLNVHPGNLAAVTAYRSWGYTKVGDAHPWPGAPPHEVMLLAVDALRPPAPPAGP